MNAPLFTVAMIGYGPYMHVAANLRRLFDNADDPTRFESMFWANVCSQQTMQVARAYRDLGKLTFLFESGRNVNKCPAWRTMNQVCRTKYMLLLDDDVEVQKGWDTCVAEMIGTHGSFDASGRIQRWKAHPLVNAYVRQQPWYDPKIPLRVDNEAFLWGGARLLNVYFLRKWNFPNMQMIIQGEDDMLTHLLRCQNGKLLNWDARERSYFNVNGMASRGTNRTMASGRDVTRDPVTGEPTQCSSVAKH